MTSCLRSSSPMPPLPCTTQALLTLSSPRAFFSPLKEDSIPGIFDTLKRCAQISKHAGGIGLAIHNARAKDSYIRGTNGKSNGLVPMLRVFNDTARYVDQGGGKRKGSFAMYLEPWHADIFDFLELRKNHGNEAERARDLFYALWISDLFMQRVEQDGSGRCSARMRRLGWLIAGVPSLKPSSQNMSSRALHAALSRHARYGRLSSSHRLRPAPPSCCTRMPATASQTSRTWEPSSPPTYAVRLWNTPRRMRWQYATWLPSTCRPLSIQRTTHMTSSGFTRCPRWWPRTSTRSLTLTSTQLRRPASPTCATAPSALVCRAWQTPLCVCASLMRVRKPGSSTRTSLRQSTLRPVRPPTRWPRWMVLMRPLRDPP
ncbi:unnamed protein product [Heterosigma akashiwo]